MAAPEAPKEEEVKEDWLVTYADAITLLMAFFVMLLTFAEYDIPAYQEAAAAIAGEISSEEVLSPTEVMMTNVQDMVYNMQADEVVSVSKDEKGIVIELASSAFYKPGSAEIRDEAIPVLKEISDMLVDPIYQAYNVEVEGHTDDDPISTPLFPSNWELSARRATRVVRFFVEGGMEPLRLKAAGFAETRPKLPNRDAKGVPIPENQAENRRVLVRVYPMSMDERAMLYRKLGIDDYSLREQPDHRYKKKTPNEEEPMEGEQPPEQAQEQGQAPQQAQ
ncbi:MAG: flagellar motor protein MotB [Rhodospirillales bacterium]